MIESKLSYSYAEIVKKGLHSTIKDNKAMTANMAESAAIPGEQSVPVYHGLYAKQQHAENRSAISSVEGTEEEINISCIEDLFSTADYSGVVTCKPQASNHEYDDSEATVARVEDSNQKCDRDSEGGETGCDNSDKSDSDDDVDNHDNDDDNDGDGDDVVFYVNDDDVDDDGGNVHGDNLQNDDDNSDDVDDNDCDNDDDDDDDEIFNFISSFNKRRPKVIYRKIDGISPSAAKLDENEYIENIFESGNTCTNQKTGDIEDESDSGNNSNREQEGDTDEEEDEEDMSRFWDMDVDYSPVQTCPRQMNHTYNYISGSGHHTVHRDDHFDEVDEFEYMTCFWLETGSGYKFPKQLPRTIEQVVKFWENDFQVEKQIFPKMSSWSKKGFLDKMKRTPDDYDEYLMYDKLYTKWVECGRSEREWSKRYWGLSLSQVLSCPKRKLKHYPVNLPQAKALKHERNHVKSKKPRYWDGVD